MRPPAHSNPSLNSLAINKLLPAGTIDLLLSPSDTSCDHRHAEDGWHALCSQTMLHYLAVPEDDSLLHELGFLMKHSFVSCTCRLGTLGDILHVRVYVIPYDLPNVQGRLRIRDEATILAPARRYLKVLFQRIMQDHNLWEGGDASLSHGQRPFICQDIVSDLHIYPKAEVLMRQIDPG